MQIGIVKESEDSRVAATADLIKFLVQQNVTVAIEKGAGESAYFSDQVLAEAGAKIESRDQVLQSDVLVSVRPLPTADQAALNPKALLISSFEPFNNADVCQQWSQSGFSLISLDMIPRTTLAQAMDVLSSMASIAGYKAVLMASTMLSRYVPMLTTSAGTIPPAKVLIIGAGVAGLQAIATARRLGAVVEAFDTRAASKDEVQSLGAKFVEVEGASDDKAAGGYAVEQTEEYKQKQQEKLKQSIQKSDIVITTAMLRGRKAPTLITKEMVEQMKPGSVIMDLASATGGNCELTQDQQTVTHNNVRIVGDSNLAEQAPEHASVLFSKNILNLLKIMIKEGELVVDKENEIINSALIVEGNEIRYKN